MGAGMVAGGGSEDEGPGAATEEGAEAALATVAAVAAVAAAGSTSGVTAALDGRNVTGGGWPLFGMVAVRANETRPWLVMRQKASGWQRGQNQASLGTSRSGGCRQFRCQPAGERRTGQVRSALVKLGQVVSQSTEHNPE